MGVLGGLGLGGLWGFVKGLGVLGLETSRGFTAFTVYKLFGWRRPGFGGTLEGVSILRLGSSSVFDLEHGK